MRASSVYGALVVLTLATLPLAGCVSNDYPALFGGSSFLNAVEADAPQPIPSNMPWQLTPASTSSIAQGERTIITVDGRYGRVKGTPFAIANLDKPLVAFVRSGPIVSACRRTIQPQAERIGASSVQTAAAGPERRNANGGRTQQVFFRVIYRRPAYLEVRQSSLLCTINRNGRTVDAHPV